MQKRTKIALLIIIGLLLLAFGVWMFLRPILDERAAQPPNPRGGTPFVATSTPGVVSTSTGIVPTPTNVPIDPLVQMQNRAKIVLERTGSGSSQTGFLGYQDVMLDMTASGRQAMLQAQAALQKEHPMTGELYTRTTRAVSSALKQGNIGDVNVVITVEMIQTENSGSAKEKASAKRGDVTFAQQGDGKYLVDSIVWSDIAL